MGELAEVYGLADLAFVGGSLVPLGGHNPLEPAIYGVPVLFGPHIEHFRKAAEILMRVQAAVQVKNSQEFFDSARKLLYNNGDSNLLAQKVRTAIQVNSGTAQNSVKEIFKLVQ
jgi:3-deoxy-D-manno-octulosonic-acid transferase